MKLTFIGATHEVTGSCSLVEVGGEYYLIDCGMEQGENVFENVPLPLAPGNLAGVFLTHDSIAYSVLQRAQLAVERFNREIRRDSLIRTEILPREGGDYSVILGLDDEVGSLMKYRCLI